MTITNYILVDIVNKLNHYSKMKLPQKISFAITKNLLLLSNDSTAYSTSLNKIYDEYDEFFVRDKNGEKVISPSGVPLVDKDHLAEYESELSELLNMKIDVEFYHIDLSAFEYCDDKYDLLTADDIIGLQNILYEV